MKYLLLAAAAMLPAWSASSAQDSQDDKQDMRVRVGLGAKVEPEYVGADGYRVGPFPSVSIARGDELFTVDVPDDNFSIPIIRSGGFAFGPVANLANKRKDSDVGAPIGKVPTTFELGAFAEYDFDDTMRIRSEVRKGIGGHDGIVGSVGIDKIWRDGDRYVFSLGPRLIMSDSTYQRAYFGVTPSVALATGLPTYRPGGGIHALAAASGLTLQLNDRIGLFSFARYERLVGNAAKSPVIRNYGSRNQLSGGLGLSYTFTIRR